MTLTIKDKNVVYAFVSGLSKEGKNCSSNGEELWFGSALLAQRTFKPNKIELEAPQTKNQQTVLRMLRKALKAYGFGETSSGVWYLR